MPKPYMISDANEQINAANNPSHQGDTWSYVRISRRKEGHALNDLEKSRVVCVPESGSGLSLQLAL